MPEKSSIQMVAEKSGIQIMAEMAFKLVVFKWITSQYLFCKLNISAQSWAKGEDCILLTIYSQNCNCYHQAYFVAHVLLSLGGPGLVISVSLIALDVL